MRILFGREQFSSGLPWEGLFPFLPGYEIIACSRNTLSAHVEKTDVVVPFGSRVDRTLIEQGQSGLIQQFGAGLETVDNHPFFRQNEVVIPYIAGFTEAFYQSGARVFAESIERFANGDVTLYAVNRSVHPRYPLRDPH